LSAFLRLRREQQGTLLCMLAAAGSGAMGVFAKVAYDAGFEARSLLLLRFLAAAAVMWGIVALRRPARPPLRTVLIAALLGAIGFALQAGLYFTSLERIDASLAALVVYAYPAMVLLGAIALRWERPSALRAGALALALAGIVVVLAGGGTGAIDPAGVAFALAAAVASAAYVLLADRTVGGVDPFLLSAIILTSSGVAIAGWNAVAGMPALHVGASGWAAIAAVVCVSTIMPVTAFLLGLRRVGAGTASIVSTVEPVVAAAMAMALLGERLTPLQLLGAAAVLGAIVLVNLRRAPRPAPRVDSRRDPAAVAAAPAAARPLAEQPARG